MFMTSEASEETGRNGSERKRRLITHTATARERTKGIGKENRPSPRGGPGHGFQARVCQKQQMGGGGQEKGG